MLMRQIAAFLLLSFVYCVASAQSNFKPAFIVKNNGDTLKGFIEQGNEGKISSKVSFKTDVNEKTVQTFTVDDITAFGFDDGNTFKKIEFNNTLENKQQANFGECLLSGYYSLYYFLKDEHGYYVVKSRQDSTYLLYDDMYTTTGSYVQAGNFKNILLFLATGCDNLKNRVQQLGFSEKEVVGFVTDVNKCVAPTETSTALYKKPKTENHIFAYAGGMYVGKGHEITGRVITSFTIPAIDRRTSINIGINYMQHSQSKDVYIPYLGNIYGNTTPETIVTNTVSIPVTIEYRFTDGKIQPYFGAGVCYIFRHQSGELNQDRKPTSFSDSGPTYVITAGIDYTPVKNLAIKAEWRQEYGSHYPTLGIAYFFK